MKMLLKIRIPTEKGNEVIRNGTLATTMKSILDEQKPEAVYFTSTKGERTGFIVIEVPSASDIPRIAEPWFLSFNANIQFYPVMTPEDLGKAGPWIEAAVKKYA